ncbi:MAG: PAS domain-containing sensor histidine kinase [Rickettsiaceae bacterium]|nr:PAS domain-containing sensor histidine kinase [Rickettsiaceae bacterium]
MTTDINNQLLDAIKASIYWKNLEGVYLGCNKYMLKMCGFTSKDQIVGKTDFMLPWRKQATKIREIDKIVVESNKAYEIEEAPRIHNGVEKVFLSSKAPLLGDCGEIIGTIGVSIDITEKKKLENILSQTQDSLARSLSIKERFLRNISHETRNPMQAFVCTAEILADKWEKFSEEQKKEAVTLIAESARRIETLINKTFDLSNLISNREKLTLKKASLTSLVKNCAESVINFLPSKKVPKIMIHSPKEYELMLDEEKIQQVVEHLLQNAVKWTSPENTIAIELYDSFMPDSDIPAVQCCIRDQGIKIPEEELEFIFEPFAESSKTASKASGVGLGLALCRELIKLHMGVIWAENNIKQGAVFNFLIPKFLSVSSV